MRKLLKENYRNLPEKEEQEQRERTPEGGRSRRQKAGGRRQEAGGRR